VSRAGQAYERLPVLDAGNVLLDLKGDGLAKISLPFPGQRLMIFNHHRTSHKSHWIATNCWLCQEQRSF
jgi:hypothetical protein